MGWLEAIPIIGDLFKGTTDIIKEAVTDKDKQNEIIGNLEELKRQFEQALYLKELDTKTVPWVDALHKMGRQLLNYFTIAYCLVALFMGHEISQNELLLLGSPNVAYQLIKGWEKKGK
jgi:hypothetical protein